jgi:hypothetical protein
MRERTTHLLIIRNYTFNSLFFSYFLYIIFSLSKIINFFFIHPTTINHKNSKPTKMILTNSKSVSSHNNHPQQTNQNDSHKFTITHRTQVIFIGRSAPIWLHFSTFYRWLLSHRSSFPQSGQILFLSFFFFFLQ